MKACRLCGSLDTSPLWADYQGGNWRRCLHCGSDSSDSPYDIGIYRSGYVKAEVESTGGVDRRAEEVRSNCDWFPHYAHVCKGKDFLDVGCCDGAAMRHMHNMGWPVHGFDVTEDAHQPGCTTIAPYFAASLFPQRYHAVLCREVIEHVETPRQFLVELHAVLHHDGLLQIQTPRPWKEPHGVPYQKAHLQLFSPAQLELMVTQLGFHVLDRRFWDYGQAWLFQKVAGV